MKLAEPSSRQWRLAALAVSALAFVMPLPATGKGLKVGRRLRADPPLASAPGQLVPPAAAAVVPPVQVSNSAGASRTDGNVTNTTLLVPAIGAIRPGIVVRLTDSLEQLRYDLNFVRLAYRPLMEDMLGKDYVVVQVWSGDIVGLHSPDGTQNGVWYFPAYSLRPWLDTADAKQAPVPGLARRSAGLPTDTEFEIMPPSQEASPWDYSIKHKKLMDPIAPPMVQPVDLKKTSMQLPPFRKVLKVKDVDCMEKLHKDPHFICDPEDYVGHVSPPTTTQRPLTPEEAEAMAQHIRHLKATLKAMKPKERRRRKPADDPVDTTPVSMNAAVSDSNQHNVADDVGKRMDVYGQASDARMHTANGQWRSSDHKPVTMNREMRDLFRERDPDDEVEVAR
jgi:hypothetical protein